MHNMELLVPQIGSALLPPLKLMHKDQLSSVAEHWLVTRNPQRMELIKQVRSLLPTANLDAHNGILHMVTALLITMNAMLLAITPPLLKKTPKETPLSVTVL